LITEIHVKNRKTSVTDSERVGESESRRRSEGNFIVRREKRHSFVRKFPGFAHSPLKAPRRCLFVLLVDVIHMIRINFVHDAGRVPL
jgi:hypothetical protein